MELRPVSATFSAEVVSDRLLRITHEGGDALLGGRSAVNVTHHNSSGGSGRRELLGSSFGPGDTGWVYVDDEKYPAFTPGDRPEPGGPLSGTVSLTFFDPFASVVQSRTIPVE